MEHTAISVGENIVNLHSLRDNNLEDKGNIRKKAIDLNFKGKIHRRWSGGDKQVQNFVNFATYPGFKWKSHKLMQSVETPESQARRRHHINVNGWFLANLGFNDLSGRRTCPIETWSCHLYWTFQANDARRNW